MPQTSTHRALTWRADLLLRYRRSLFIAAMAVSVLSFIEGSKLTLEHSIESLYSLDDPHLIDYRESKSLFGGDEFVIVAYTEPDLLTADGLDSLAHSPTSCRKSRESNRAAPNI